MQKYLIIAGVAVAVLLLARAAQAKALSDVWNPANWNYIPGYKPGSGLIV